MTDGDKKHGNTGNHNASKGEGGMDSFLHIRCARADKAGWVRAANGPLSEWVIDVLNAAAKNKVEGG